jgi:uncharacterized membrane protein YozB (DUF420 family)
MDPAIFLPTLNATLNATSAVLLAAGFWAVRTRRLALHRGLMLAAVGVSAAFLVSYLVYHFGFQLTKRYEGAGRGAYLLLLATHTILAAVTLPLVLVTLARALRGQRGDTKLVSAGIAARFARHRAVARWTLPIWLYVSITGVVIYLLLYVIV